MVGGRDEAAIAADIWPDPIPKPTPAMRLKRMHHITAIGSDAAEIERFYSAVLGLRLVKRTVNFDNPTSPHLYFGVGGGAPGTIVTYFAYPRGTMRPVRPGAGMTHHFALGVADDDALREWRDYLHARDFPTTGVRDRAYFRSFAFHDPDGHLLEIATDAPGFVVDESRDDLGKRLQLPPWLEADRGDIEQNLSPLVVPAPIGR
jgi:glyoxalase family protein